MKKKFAKILLLCFLFVNLLPVTALAAGDSDPPREPYEKVAAKSGSWYTEQMSYNGKANLVIGYKGSYGQQAEEPVIGFKLSEKILLTSVYVPYAGMDAGEVSLAILDSRGNVYQGFYANAEFTGGIKEDRGGGMAGEASAPGRNTLYSFSPGSKIVLPKGSYTLYLDGEKLPVGAFLVKGYSYAAWEKYEKELMEWILEGEEAGEEEPGTEAGEEAPGTGLGSEELAEIYEQYAEGEENEEAPQWQGESQELYAPVFSLDKEYVIDEIVLSTWNGGQGAAPGVVSIYDEVGNAVASWKAQGASQGGVPNTLWAVMPGILLPPGNYYIDMDTPEALDYDEAGEPVFYVEVSVPAVPPVDFTGTYKIWLDLYKTHTLTGPVEGGESSFSLEDHELTVLDKGSVIELIGQYEGMPFSQNCEVTQREKNLVVAKFNFSADLTKLPYKAKIAAIAELTLEKDTNGRITVGMTGQGFYSRAATKEKGADENTYSLSLRGGQSKKDLPPFVMTAIGKAYGAGNIPGPDTPAEAAAGMLFPPLVGLVVSTLQNLLKPKGSVAGLSSEGGRKLSVGEQAMKDANQSLGKGLYTEEEAKAWTALGDALGASGGDAEDAVSIGDNERPGGADYTPPRESGFGGYDDYDSGDYGGEDYGRGESPFDEYGQEAFGYGEPAPPEKVFGSEREQLEAERDEWLDHLKSSRASADPNDPRSAELHTEYENYINSLNEKINSLGAAEQFAGQKTMTVQVDHTGRTAEIIYDPETDTWSNTETGNEFNMEKYQKDVAPNFAKDKAFIDEQRRKLETGDTAHDKALKAMVEDNKARDQLYNQLKKLRDRSYGIEPPAEGVGDVQANVNKLMNQLSDRKIPIENIREQAGRISKVVTGRDTGRTLSEAAGKELAENALSFGSQAKTFGTEAGLDVVQGRTWAGMAGRAALAAVTGGTSEYVLSPVEALIDIKEGMDAGDSGTSATAKAIGKYVLGEILGEGAGRGIGKAWKSSGIGETQLAKNLGKLGNTPVSELVDKALGKGLKSGSKEFAESAGIGVGKQALGAADGSLSKAAAEAAEYNKYMAGVKDQANIIESKIRNAAPNRPVTPGDVSKALSGDDMRKVLRDPSVTRELKNADKGIQKAYQEALDNKIYNPVKKNTAEQLQKDLLEDVQKKYGKNAKIDSVEIDSIRTPDPKGTKSPLNADHDVTGKYTIDVDGKKITVEIPAKDVAPAYNKNFAEASGMMKDGKFDVAKAKAEMPEGIDIIDAKGNKRTIDWSEATEQQQLEAFAKKHNQEVTDAFSSEAAIDFNATRNADGISNVAKLKAGDLDAALADPGGLANMEAAKINKWFNSGGMANQTEAYEQLAKMGKLSNDLTKAYQKLGYGAKDMDASMKKALDIVSDRNLSPGTRTVELQKLGFQGPQDVANKLSGRIEGLQKLGSRGAAGAAGENPMLSKVSSIIIGSYLNDNKK